MIKHADIEDEFGICVPDSVNIVKDDEHIEPAQVDCKIALRNSTLKLIRAFTPQKNQLLLKSYVQTNSPELENFR